MVRVQDKGSQPHCAPIQIQGVPAYGIIDSGADITIIGGNLFRKVAAAARLKKRDLQKPDKTPRTYDQKPFQLDGRMDLDISFSDQTMRTPVYIKMDTHDQLLLSEGVCRQLKIVAYHADVEKWRGRRKQASEKQPAEAVSADDAQVPTVRIRLVQTIQVPPLQSALVRVRVEGAEVQKKPVLMERSTKFVEETGLQLEDVLLQPDGEHLATMVISNPTAIRCEVEGNSCLRGGSVIVPIGDTDTDSVPEDAVIDDEVRDSEVKRIEVKDEELRKQKLCNLITLPDVLKPEEKSSLLDFLTEHNSAFCLDEYDLGETDLVELTIDTGDAQPRKQPPRRMPFAVRQEVASQLRKMQEVGVVQPSSSPWASPVVMVRKKDGSHRFCVDYRELNAITKADTFPLPRIDDLLDQLGRSHYFTTLDLASGYWQIKVSPESREKTAFVTPQGLFEFRVMPFGLTNAPAVFQRLMQRVLMGLNPAGGKDFVAVYIDDVLVFSHSLEDHLEHL